MLRAFLKQHWVALSFTFLGIAATFFWARYYFLSSPYSVIFSYSKIPIVSPVEKMSLKLYIGQERATNEVQNEVQAANLLEVKNLVAVKVTVQNEGPQPVRSGDYDIPLSISPVPGAKIVASNLGGIARQDLRPELQLENGIVRIKPAVLEKQDFFEIDMLVADDPRHGTSDCPVGLAGHIVGVRDYELKRYTQTHSIVSMVLVGFGSVFTAILLFGILTTLDSIKSKTDDKRTLDAFMKAAKGCEDSKCSISDVHSLAASGMSSASSVGRLISVAMQHDSPSVRIAAVENLGYLVAAHYVMIRRAGIPTLLLEDILKNDSVPEVRAAAVVALRQIKLGPKHESVVRAANSDADEKVRWLAGLGSGFAAGS